MGYNRGYKFPQHQEYVMKKGTLVKWILRGNDYGHLGIVIDVYQNGNFQVWWIKDDNIANHGYGTEHIEIIYK